MINRIFITYAIKHQQIGGNNCIKYYFQVPPYKKMCCFYTIPQTVTCILVVSHALFFWFSSRYPLLTQSNLSRYGQALSWYGQVLSWKLLSTKYIPFISTQNQTQNVLLKKLELLVLGPAHFSVSYALLYVP